MKHRRSHERYGLKFGMLVYPDHLQNWLNLPRGLLIFPFWPNFDLVEGVKFGIFGHSWENTWKQWSGIRRSDISWPPSGLIRFWSQSVDVPILVNFLVKRVKVGGSGHSLRTYGRDGLDFGMLMWVENIFLDYIYIPWYINFTCRIAFAFIVK